MVRHLVVGASDVKPTGLYVSRWLEALTMRVVFQADLTNREQGTVDRQIEAMLRTLKLVRVGVICGPLNIQALSRRIPEPRSPSGVGGIPMLRMHSETVPEESNQNQQIPGS